MKRRLFIFRSLVLVPAVLIRFKPLNGFVPDQERLKIAYCGKDCSECTVYRATMTNDPVLKRKIASEWSGKLNMPITASSISCYGCKIKSGSHFCYCNTCKTAACKKDTPEEELCYYDCRIRKCAEMKKFSNCNQCNEYPCNNHLSIKRRLFTS